VAYRHLIGTPIHAALTVAAIVALLRPASFGALTLLAALTAATVVLELPNVFNHWFFTGLVSLALFGGCVAAWRAGHATGAPSPAERLGRAFAPAARWSLILLYGWSGFHKLNHDFLDPELSCATVLAGSLGQRLALSAPPFDGVLVWLTLLTELGLPVLLLFPRLRLAGVALGSGFHLAMAAAGYPRFSAVGLALLTLFLPVGALRLDIARASRLAFGVARGAALLRHGWPLGGLAILAGALFATAWTERLMLALTAALAVGLALLAGAAWRRGAAPVETALRPGTAWPAMAGPLLILLAGLTPYAGLGTDRALAMYSNLRTEGGTTNHLLIPSGVQRFGFQRDLVQVLFADAPRLQELAEGDLVLPYQEFRARLTEEVHRAAGPVRIRYRHGGAELDREVALPDSALALPVSALARKFLRFRAVERSDPRACGV